MSTAPPVDAGGSGYAMRQLLPDGRLTGPMPWVIAVMMFLTVLATAGGLALHASASAINSDVSDRVTIQVAEPDPQIRGQAVQRIVSLLQNGGDAGSVTIVPQAELEAQLAPWLGSDLKMGDVPLPALIDADIVVAEARRDERIAALGREISAINPHAQVEPHAAYLGPLARLVSGIGWLAFGLVFLMGSATGAVVVLAARGAHATHRGTIDIMHMLGATDAQVVRLFQQRMMLDAAFGSVLGFTCAVIVILLVGRSVGAVASDLVQSVGLPLRSWLVLPPLPVAGVAVAWLSARITLQRAMSRSL
jgi:cell division transport system permease protein